MPKKKKQSSKTTQSQSQKVIVNIGTATARKRKRRKGGGGTVAYRHNLAPTFITTPQVDYTPLLAMMQYQTRSLQPEAVTNPVTPLSSATVANAEQMAGQAAISRAELDASSTASSKFVNRERQERETMEKEDIRGPSPRAQPKESRKVSSSGRKQRRPGPTSETLQPNSQLDRRLESEEPVEPPDPLSRGSTVDTPPDTPVAERKDEYQRQEQKFGAGEQTKKITLEDPRYEGSRLVLARPTGARVPAALPKDEEIGYTAGEPVLAKTKLGPKFKDPSKLARAESIEGPLATRQGDFVPTGNPTGFLETPTSTPRDFVVKQAGLVEPTEFSYYKYLESKAQKGEPLSQMRQTQRKILRRRLEEFGVVKEKK